MLAYGGLALYNRVHNPDWYSLSMYCHVSARTALPHSTGKLLIPFTSTWPDHSHFTSYAFALYVQTELSAHTLAYNLVLLPRQHTVHGFG